MESEHVLNSLAAYFVAEKDLLVTVVDLATAHD